MLLRSYTRVLTPYSSRVSILESGKLAQYEWICKDHLESWRALLSTVEAAGLARHTGHITARKVTTLSHRYQQVDKPAMTRTAATSTWLCTSPTSSPGLCRASSRNSTAGTSLLTLARHSGHAPQRRFLSPFGRRNDECLRSSLICALIGPWRSRHK